MVNIQIGNTFRVRWKIITNGKDESLAGRDIMPILLAPSGKPQRISIQQDAEDPAVFSFTFEGKSQKELGVYRLVAVENKGGKKQALTDEIMAFRLVATAEEATPGATPFIELPLVLDGKRVQTVFLSGVTVPINGCPMEISHGMDKYPSVTVVMRNENKDLEEVTAYVEYPDRNTVRVSWDIEENIEGFIYLI